MATTVTSFYDLFKKRYMRDITVADTAIALKLYPNAEKLENGQLKIGERSMLEDLIPDESKLLKAVRK